MEGVWASPLRVRSKNALEARVEKVIIRKPLTSSLWLRQKQNYGRTPTSDFHMVEMACAMGRSGPGSIFQISRFACVRCFVLIDTENKSSHSGVVWRGRGDAYGASLAWSLGIGQVKKVNVRGSSQVATCRARSPLTRVEGERYTLGRLGFFGRTGPYAPV